MSRLRWPALLACVVMALGSPAVGQAPESQTEIATVEDIVVVARRAGAPMWTITQGASTLIVVGEVDGVPRDLQWRPEALEAAAARSQRILFPQVRRGSMADVGRLLWRARSVVMLPGEETTADYLPAPDQRRLEAIFAEDNSAWNRNKLMILSYDLLEKAGYLRRGDLEVSGTVRRAGRKADVPMRSIGVLRGDDYVETLINAPQSQHVGCIQAAIPAAEGGTALNTTRAEDWRGLRVPAVLANPLERAIGQCWPYGDPVAGRQITAEWLTAIETSLNEPGATMAVAPLRLLAEPGGVLDTLEARGADIIGPAWKAE